MFSTLHSIDELVVTQPATLLRKSVRKQLQWVAVIGVGRDLLVRNKSHGLFSHFGVSFS